MKKITLILLAVFSAGLISCSSDEVPEDSAHQINPPQWIHGEWLQEDADGNSHGYRFTSDDLVTIMPPIETSQKSMLNQMAQGGYEVSASETISDDHYSLTTGYDGQKVTYNFYKVSETEIYWENPDNIYVKQ